MNDTSLQPSSSVARLLWRIALLSLCLGGLVSPATADGIGGLLVLGHGLTLLALASEAFAGRQTAKPAERGITAGVLLTFLVIELVAFNIASHAQERDQAIWFSSASSFALVGILACWRSLASDGVITAQLLFHVTMIVPAAGAIMALGASSLGYTELRYSVLTAGPLAKVATIVAGVFLPITFTLILAVLGHAHARNAGQDSRVWTVILVHEAANILVAARWCFNGI